MRTAVRKVVCMMAVDLVCLLLVAAPTLLLNLTGEPTVRGFFCSDPSIALPWQKSTVPTWALILLSYSLPAIVICLVETANLKHADCYSEARLARQVYHMLGLFVFGSMVTLLLTDTTKYTVGRLRPHFLAVCRPALQPHVCGTAEQPLYVTNYTCRGEPGPDSQHQLAQMRLSFVSGHASLSVYSMWFCIVYLQQRMGTRNFRLVKPLIQLGCALAALFTCLTRVSDNQHHPGDVVAGAGLGLTVASLGLHLVGSGRGAAHNYKATSTTSLLDNSTQSHPLPRLYTLQQEEMSPINPAL